ncbi:MAG: efflux RND transporter periplasmic adaptor subunit [Halioglobus sp.]
MSIFEFERTVVCCRERFVTTTLFTILLATSMLAGCDGELSSHESKAETTPDTSSPVNVTTAMPEYTSLSEPIFVTGTVLARRTTSITPMVGGLIEEIFVNVGSRVEKGQPLLRMRQKDFEIKVSRVSEARRLAEAEHKDAKRDLDNAIALEKKKALSAELLDDRRTRVEVTEAKLGIADANLAETQKELEDSITRAPYRGVITKRHVDEGAYVPSIMRSERPVLQIQQIDVMVAVVLVPESHLNAIEIGTPGKVRIPSMNQTFESKVALINDRIDHKTRTIDVRLGIPNEDYAIKPGLFIEVELKPTPRQALVLPPEATTGSGSSRRVLLVEDGVVSQREVQVRELRDGRIEVIGGITAEAVLIVGPSMRSVSPGSKVIIEERPYVAS